MWRKLWSGKPLPEDSVFKLRWAISTVNLENGASKEQPAALVETVGFERVYFLQAYTRDTGAIMVGNRQISAYANSSSRKRFAFLLPAGMTMQRHFLEEYYYSIDFDDIIALNVHVRKLPSEE